MFIHASVIGNKPSCHTVGHKLFNHDYYHSIGLPLAPHVQDYRSGVQQGVSYVGFGGLDFACHYQNATQCYLMVIVVEDGGEGHNIGIGLHGFHNSNLVDTQGLAHVPHQSQVDHGCETKHTELFDQSHI